MPLPEKRPDILSTIDNNRRNAERRLVSLVNKTVIQDPELLTQYHNIIQDYC